MIHTIRSLFSKNRGGDRDDGLFRVGEDATTHQIARTYLEQLMDIDKVLNDILVSDFGGFMPYESLASWEVGEVKNLDGNLTTKIYEDKHHMKFKSIIPSGTSFLLQWHDMIEHCIVLQGEMIDRETGKVFKAGDVATFLKGVKHVPANRGIVKGGEPLVVSVTFLNPKYV